MLRKFLETKSNGVTEGGTDQAPRPGDYDLGSLSVPMIGISTVALLALSGF